MRVTATSARVVLIALAVSACRLAWGDGAIPPSPTDTSAGAVREITRLESERAILTQQLAVAKLKAAIAKAGAGGASGTTPGSPGAMRGEGTRPDAPAGSVSAPQGLPEVLSLYGSGQDMQAVLGYASGGTLTVRAGASLPQGARVVSVTSSAVVVLSHGVRHTLVFASAPPATTPASGPFSGTMGQPGYPIP